MAPVAIMLLGTGTLAGIIANSGLKDVLISGLTASGLPSYLLAPISGALMSLATASTTAGTVVASNVFSSTLLELGVSALAGAAMIHAGATVFDQCPTAPSSMLLAAASTWAWVSDSSSSPTKPQSV